MGSSKVQAFFFLGWYFKTEFGWWQDLHKEDVKILAFVNFAINIKCRTLEKKYELAPTFLSTVGSQSEGGPTS
jgi:hypothetical protein